LLAAEDPVMATSPTNEDLNKCKTAKDVAKLYGPYNGKNFLITGANSGFGLEQSLVIASEGGNVIMACRPGSKSDEIFKKVESAAKNGGKAYLLPLDLAVTSSIRDCALKYESLRSQLPNKGALTALVLNAGIIGLSFGVFSPDQEPQLQVNLLGHALLHELLQPALQASSDSRVVVVASGSHYWITNPSGLNWNEELPPRKENFDYGRAYGFSNLCRILWAKALSKKVSYPVVSLHPACALGTNAGRNMSIGVLLSVLPRAAYYEFAGLTENQSVGNGTRTQTYVAVAPIEEIKKINGTFLSGNITDGPLGKPVTPSKFAQRDDYAEIVYKFVNAFVNKEKQ